MRPTVSVIISTYYRNDLVQDAIESVLTQDYEPVELIVVDDSGEGHAEPVLRQYEDDLRALIMDENGGWGRAYTTGIEAATGEYIHLLDDDDYFLDGKLTKSVHALEDNPEAGVVYTGLVSDVRGRQYPDPDVSGDVLEWALRFKMYPCCTITMLVERDVLVDTLPLAEYADDLALKIELARRTNFEYVDECLVYRRKQESRKWVGLEKFEEMKELVRRQRDLYDQYPEIRRAVLAERYEEEGQVRLDQRLWSATAILCFLKATYYADETRARCAGQVLVSLFGQPGLNAARRLRQTVVGGPADSPEVQ